ncbi:hypothetical protein LTR64_003870 [Lithohypha guttulata]|uniref:uncharacterized protein n=1 Tax=Lithohypha guttulata TaxID=1690604 RepID=UPI002DDE1212|nr:hypothetical protein LTR51_006908 [Lithohypha guttulata]
MATSLNLLWFLLFMIFLSSSVAFDSRNVLERRKANLAPGLTPDPPPRHPSYDIGRYIEFYQFDALAGEWATTYKSWVVNTLIEAMDVMQNAVTVLSDDAATGGPPANPSFRRYFFDADIHGVTNVFRRLLAAIGAPGYEHLRQSYVTMLCGN